MKRTAVFVSLLSLLAMFIVGALLAQEEAKPVSAKPEKPATEFREVPAMGFTGGGRVLSIQDGDTLKVEFRFIADIRLLDCWAPEIHGPTKEAGIRSREHLKKLAEGQPCIVHIPLTHENIGRATTLGRILGKVYVNGDDLSYEQVRKKMATKEKPE